MKEDFDQFVPLSPAALSILLALASEDRHGYGIMREVARQSDNRYRLGPGTLYDNLQKASTLEMPENFAPRVLLTLNFQLPTKEAAPPNP